MGPLESLGHRESGTAKPSSGDSSQPSNEPFEGGHSTPFSRHFLNKKILWTSFLDPSFFHHGEGANYGLLSAPLLKRDENFRANKHAS